MKLRWLRPFIVLVAALIICISNMVSQRPVLKSLLWLLAVIIIFFIIGSIATRLIDRTMNTISTKEEPQKWEAVEKGEEEKKEGEE